MNTLLLTSCPGENPMSEHIPRWLLEKLTCPVDGSPLIGEGAYLVSAKGRRYPVVDGVPVMLRADLVQTMDLASASIAEANSFAEGNPITDPLFLNTIGVSARERHTASELHKRGVDYDPVIAVMVGATSGIAYNHLRGKLIDQYPIPSFRFELPAPGTLLDIGCNWGRWTVAAALAGHQVVGIDPQLGSVLAAKRLARKLGVEAAFVVGDARCLPFFSGAFDYAWSYSVLQHFSKKDAMSALGEVGRVLRSGGISRIQMANVFGVRSIYHMLRRRFAEPEGFDVRYWRPRDLVNAFEQEIGKTRLSADCFLGLGLQKSDFKIVSGTAKLAIGVSETLKSASSYVPILGSLADSVFLESYKQ